MEYRITQSRLPDAFGDAGYWVEKKNENGFWWMVEGTIAPTAGESWDKLEALHG